eukprot:294510-Pleurochrysis_carterae.AAC.1
MWHTLARCRCAVRRAGAGTQFRWTKETLAAEPLGGVHGTQWNRPHQQLACHHFRRRRGGCWDPVSQLVMGHSPGRAQRENRLAEDHPRRGDELALARALEHLEPITGLVG